MNDVLTSTDRCPLLLLFLLLLILLSLAVSPPPSPWSFSIPIKRDETSKDVIELIEGDRGRRSEG